MPVDSVWIHGKCTHVAARNRRSNACVCCNAGGGEGNDETRLLSTHGTDGYRA